jgi:heparinase II/III-like protein
MPQYQWRDRPLETWLKEDIPSTPGAYADWRRQNSPKFLFETLRAERSRSESGGAVEAPFTSSIPWNPQHVIHEANRILSGELEYFFHTYYPTGFPPDWHRDPVTGVKLDSQKHWSEISDDANVDIKFIWEASRFGMVYTIIRAYEFSGDEKYAEAFWELIDSWAESNPPNTGPNWMDGQEAALRLLAWTFGFYAFIDSPSTSPERIAQMIVLVAAHAERIYRNIDYAISTHSNHTISEGFGLWLAGLLFPELKNAEKYFAFGRRLLEQESIAQIFPDGSYSMYSLNYHRFVLHLYLLAIRLGEMNHSPVSTFVLNRVSASIDYLSQLIDPESGKMPGFGSNDGALVLPLNNCDFTDYRPLLQLGSYLTKGTRFFGSGAWDEPLYWFYGSQTLQADVHAPPQANRAYPDGGIFIVQHRDSKAIIRCTDHRSRPSHADQLHVDLWIRGHNIAVDAGTYLYSGAGIWRNGLAHTSVHNTVVVDYQDQMKMLTRFTWTNWSHGKVLRQDENIWQGEHDGYRRLPDPVNHRRTVISLDEDRRLIVDYLAAKSQHHYTLHWLLTDGEYGRQEFSSANGLWLKPADSTPSDSKVLVQTGLLKGNGDFSIVRADPKSTRGWRSQYYGEKEPAISLMLETDQPSVTFWTFFGFEGDIVELDRNTWKINSQAVNLMDFNK